MMLDFNFNKFISAVQYKAGNHDNNKRSRTRSLYKPIIKIEKNVDLFSSFTIIIIIIIII